ncbi:phosphatidylinositol-3,5-bisphosphate 5-phosphatase [Coemansia sp. RSA 2530]|nr:phosphatidylinositol-3,5-bisphosphate 5-phosphatase [Coemansia sp. RSA 2530]
MAGDADLPLLRRPTVVLTSFDIYESKTLLCIVGSNESEGYYRVLRITRGTDDVRKMVDDDMVSHSRDSIHQLVARLQASGMRLLVSKVCGILGFVRFTKGCYISLVAKRKPVALLGGHYIYHVEDTRLISVAYRPERSEVEEKCIATFKNVDLTKNFYYSHTYDITHTLQKNVLLNREPERYYHSMFVWNYQLICNATQAISCEWTLALIHGYVDQSKLSMFGRDVYVTLIARRSRIFAGVRYLKRGVNDAGYVANDVETEQIVNTMELTSFDMPYGRPFSNPYYTAYVQHRGSIPLFWSQETSGIAPKPPIEINVRDPYFVEAGRHFDSLFQRYGTPVIVLNLIKTKERAKRESLLGEEFSEGLHYLNQFLPRGKKIRYLAWDMSRAKKNRQEDVLAILEVIAEETLSLTGIFHNGAELYSNYLKRHHAGDSNPLRTRMRRQTGVVRSNCIDCLDRTNAAQSIIGKVALAHQLFELGQINEPLLSFNTDAAMIIEEMYHDLGNTIALQYGGSHLVNTVQTYRRNTNWRSHSRDIVESLRRYYSNSLLDMERQEAITFFVEKSIFPPVKPSDTATPRSLSRSPAESPSGGSALPSANDAGKIAGRPNQVDKPVFRKWWTSLGDETESDDNGEEVDGAADNSNSADGYWNEYYRPHEYTSLESLFVGSINSSASLHPSTNAQNMPSPFADRGNTTSSGSSDQQQRRQPSERLRYMQQEPKWLKSESEEYTDPTTVSRQEIYERVCAKTTAPQILQPMCVGGWMTDGITSPLQEPKVSEAELDEYEKYVHQFDDLKKWIVPPSNVLYTDYVMAQAESSRGSKAAAPLADTASVFGSATGMAKSAAGRQHRMAVPGGMRIHTGTESGFRHSADRQRSQTPTLGGLAPFSAHPSLSATSSRGHLHRLFGADSGQEQQGRLRSNTASHERGSLWGLWPQPGDNVSGGGRLRNVGMAGRGNMSAHPLASSNIHNLSSANVGGSQGRGRYFHDRSRSLDLEKMDTGKGSLRLPAFGAERATAAPLPMATVEPRVAESDLKIYQDYVKMRKTFDGHRDRTTDEEERMYRNTAIIKFAGFVAMCAAMSIFATKYKLRIKSLAQ